LRSGGFGRGRREPLVLEWKIWAEGQVPGGGVAFSFSLGEGRGGHVLSGRQEEAGGGFPGPFWPGPEPEESRGGGASFPVLPGVRHECGGDYAARRLSQ
jgi:hypothetical protein